MLEIIKTTLTGFLILGTLFGAFWLADNGIILPAIIVISGVFLFVCWLVGSLARE